MAKALTVYMGREAAARISETGWSPELFTLLLGASGGPKWFVLSQLDRVLFGDFLARRQAPLDVLGSSIGTWRHACFATSDPVAAIGRLESGYMGQRYAQRPSVDEVSEVSTQILSHVLGEHGAREIVENPRVRTHIVTARGRGIAGKASAVGLASGMTAAALSNSISRNLLPLHFQRVVFHSAPAPQQALACPDFNTRHCQLYAETIVPALHASGAIPFVLRGERDIAGAPGGQYWDGGIIDYHFNLDHYRGEGLLLYPHFSAKIVPGWFDKFLPWRKASLSGFEKLVMLCPSESFIADLPHGKIPDRNDFTRMGEDERIRYWEECVSRCAALAEEFAQLLQNRDPLAGVTLLQP